MRVAISIGLLATALSAAPLSAAPYTHQPLVSENQSRWDGLVIPVVTCKSYRTCEQAVRNWCAGAHPRADGDGDGIPCENVCGSLRQVRQIKQAIGCSR